MTSPQDYSQLKGTGYNKYLAAAKKTWVNEGLTKNAKIDYNTIDAMQKYLISCKIPV